MPPSKDYDFAHDDVSQSSEDDTNNIEPTIPSEDKEAYLARCHWFGSIMLNAILAESVFRKTGARAAPTELDAELAGHLYDFSYAECLEDIAAIKAIDLPNNGSHSTSALMKALKTKIGVIMDEDDPETRQNLIKLLQGGGSAKSAFADVVQAQQRSKRGGAVQPVSLQLAPHEPEFQLPMYTMRLNNWCQKNNRHAHYTSRHLSVDPPEHEVTVTVDGRTLKGTGKNVTTAKHRAAMAACEALKIKI